LVDRNSSEAHFSMALIMSSFTRSANAFFFAMRYFLMNATMVVINFFEIAKSGE